VNGARQVSQPGAPAPLRTIEDVETIRALADPTRLGILRVLMSGARTEPRVMSVKELAAELGEPQTKLYRHVKQLEACGLIEVAQTRLVSGIVEQRYRTGQIDLAINRALISTIDPDDQAAVVAALFDNIRDDVVAGLRAGRLGPGAQTASPPQDGLNVFGAWENTVSPAKAREFAERLSALLTEIGAADHDEDGVPIVVLATLYSPPYSPPDRHAGPPRWHGVIPGAPGPADGPPATGGDVAPRRRAPRRRRSP
jgi:DNA-binding transcriptional ArsR family regulator